MGTQMKIAESAEKSAERRAFRRHDLEQRGIVVKRVVGNREAGMLGRLVDLSAGGVRVRVNGGESVRADQQIRVRLELPDFAGISPFIEMQGEKARPKREWVGWMTVARVSKAEGGSVDVAGRLVDMEEMDRGMLGLYLSTQPMAA